MTGLTLAEIADEHDPSEPKHNHDRWGSRLIPVNGPESPLRVFSKHGVLTMISFAYVSRVVSDEKALAEALEDIRFVSLARNSAANVTGVLIATINHFAQVLEGSEEAVGEVMLGIKGDPRHCEITVLKNAECQLRQFRTWQQIVIGQRSFENLSVPRLLSALHSQADHQSLEKFSHLIDEIARSRPTA